MTIGFVLLDIDGVVALGEERSVVIGVANVDVDQDTGAEAGTALVSGHHLQH